MESIVLQGNKVTLRAIRHEDVQKMLDSINHPDVTKYAYGGIPFPFTIFDQERWFEKHSEIPNMYEFIINENETNQYIGNCNIVQIDHKNSHCSLGIYIGNENFIGKGYGTEAFKILLQFCFFEINMNKVKLQVYAFNKRAIKSYEKIGFKLEGVIRDDVYRFGRYHDAYAMSLLRSEFYERYGENIFD